MIYPRATDLLGNIEGTMVSHIEPSLSTLSGKSAAATIKHMLRHVRVRIEVEGQVLSEDIRALKALLGDVRIYLEAKPLESGDALSAQIVAAIAAATAEADVYRGLDELAALAGGLREALYQSLKALVSVGPERDGEADYTAIRKAIRDYLVWQVEQEDRLIAPAFFGGGPRR